jgi:hypothetical protein
LGNHTQPYNTDHDYEKNPKISHNLPPFVNVIYYTTSTQQNDHYGDPQVEAVLRNIVSFDEDSVDENDSLKED